MTTKRNTVERAINSLPRARRDLVGAGVEELLRVNLSIGGAPSPARTLGRAAREVDVKREELVLVLAEDAN
ncbi:hypothetical protein ABT263_27930 [Kitasatospora sp. NPDC001603]|uniref:hypothetical protein n=1 Tax=Kitasatospora sp. NPDC001603 TaxID=3154388 RepID=UPI00332EE70D